MSFPQNFVWGAATASYQIEGAADADGKGLSVWDVFSHQSGNVWNGHTGDVACDHYYRYEQDVELMKVLGINAYRFSLGWPRILPSGTGEVNTAGLDFYDRLVDALLAANVTPYVTLFHWDYPYELYCKGGWLNPASSDWFAEYTRVVVDKLGDRVAHWFTLNEPAVFVLMGHQYGFHAPGDKLLQAPILRMIHNVLLAHGKSVQAIRAGTRIPCQVGAAPVGSMMYPDTESPEDIAAAREWMFSANGNLWKYTWWTDPMIFGHYPEDWVTHFSQDLEAAGLSAPDEDMDTICQPLDFFGFNFYQGYRIRQGEDGQPEVVERTRNHPITSFYWPVTPEALYWGARFLWERYQKPLFVTENGLANPDWVALDGGVHDPQRIDYVHRHLLQVKRGVEDGVDFRGYFHWSLMDNFEWAHGYKHRFGMIYVDYDTQERILKDSAYWYQDIIASNGAAL